MYPKNYKDNVINHDFWNKLLINTRCDVCNKTLTYTLYKDTQEKSRYSQSSGLSIDKHFNLDVNTTGGFHHKGWLTAEVPDLPDGCRVMNPVPIRLPFDIEVCGREIVYTTNKGSFDFGFIAGVSPDLKWTNEEVLGMFNITVSK